jgi:putative membrane protein
VLLREGIIGWNVHQTYFQRRAGLVTLTATTAAGKQGYRVYDVPEPVATMVADAAVPGLLTPFLVDTTVDATAVDGTAVDATAVHTRDGV